MTKYAAARRWTHKLKKIVWHDAPFVPSQCPATSSVDDAVTVGAGIQFADLYVVTRPSSGLPSTLIGWNLDDMGHLRFNRLRCTYTSLFHIWFSGCVSCC
jgi:hypothetical protein